MQHSSNHSQVPSRSDIRTPFRHLDKEQLLALFRLSDMRRNERVLYTTTEFVVTRKLGVFYVCK